jgi:hypothetical protein
VISGDKVSEMMVRVLAHFRAILNRPKELARFAFKVGSRSAFGWIALAILPNLSRRMAFNLTASWILVSVQAATPFSRLTPSQVATYSKLCLHFSLLALWVDSIFFFNSSWLYTLDLLRKWTVQGSLLHVYLVLRLNIITAFRGQHLIAAVQSTLRIFQLDLNINTKTGSFDKACAKHVDAWFAFHSQVLLFFSGALTHFVIGF